MACAARHPFQQAAPRPVDHQRAHDRVGHQPGLVRQHREREPDLRGGQHEVATDRARMATLGDASPARDHAAQCRQECGHDDGGEDEGTPHRGRRPRHQPRHDEGQEGGRGRHRAAEVVQHLPAPDHRDAPSENPRQQLPIAARPSVLAAPRRRRSARARSRTARCRSRGRRARTRPRRDRGSAARSRAPVRPAPPRTRRRRRSRLFRRCTSPPPTDPGTRRTPPPRRLCLPGPTTGAARMSPRARERACTGGWSTA